MSDNPLDPPPEFAARVQELARELWQADGEPPAGVAAYLERADELARMELAGPTGQRTVDYDDPHPGVIVEEASIQENLGEFPAARNMGDQGRWHETPMTEEQRKEAEDRDDPQ